jgi:Zn-dependent protease with chaperone function
MDFFQHQDAARRKTGLLVVYFSLALVMMVTVLYAVVVAAFGFGAQRVEPGAALNWWQPGILAAVAAVTLGVIGLGSLYKTIELRQGGRVVAEMLGGQLISPSTQDLTERRLLNVVEEMALASGVPVPPVYLLDGEESINAFAAGFAPSDAVIGVNRGTLRYLNRDELQGVISHEFSHLLNGDMRLNIRLIGLLHGILLVALIGYYLMRFGGVSGRSSGNRKGGGGQVMLIALGALVIGSVGLFFGKLIKASVSRQREYLADASAVQFTRNPDGIAGALKKIGGLAAGSHIETPAAETASHLFFGSAFKRIWFQPFATHPPLAARIKRIDPHFDGQFPRSVPLDQQSPAAPVAPTPTAARGPAHRPPFARPGVGGALPIDPLLVLAAIGVPAQEDAQYAAHLLASLPPQLDAAIRDPWSARAVVFAMLLAEDPPTQTAQRKLLRDRQGEPVEVEAAKLMVLLSAEPRQRLLPMVEFLQGTLRNLSPTQYDQFRGTVQQLIAADQKVSLFEFFLQRVLLGHLDRALYGHRPPPIRYHSVQAVVGEAACVLSLLAHAGQRDAAARGAFDQAVAALGIDTPPEIQPPGACTLSDIDAALDKLAAASPPVKKRVLGAAIVAVAADRNVTATEAELLRVIADSLDCPIPPLAVGPIPADM